MASTLENKGHYPVTTFQPLHSEAKEKAYKGGFEERQHYIRDKVRKNNDRNSEFEITQHLSCIDIELVCNNPRQGRKQEPENVNVSAEKCIRANKEDSLKKTV